MRALVIYIPQRPVDVITLPADITVLQLTRETYRLDVAGVEWELLAVSQATTVRQLTEEVGRYAHDDDSASPEPCDASGQGPCANSV